MKAEGRSQKWHFFQTSSQYSLVSWSVGEDSSMRNREARAKFVSRLGHGLTIFSTNSSKFDNVAPQTVLSAHCLAKESNLGIAFAAFP